MKLILAIINHDDANTVTQALTKKGFSSTKLATTGGFLMAGNVTILIGVDEEKVQTVIDIIREHSHSRKQMIPTTTEDPINTASSVAPIISPCCKSPSKSPVTAPIKIGLSDML